MNLVHFEGGDESGSALLMAFPFWAQMTAQHLRAAIIATGAGPTTNSALGLGQVANDVLRGFGFSCTRHCEPAAEFVVRTTARALGRRRDRVTSTVAIARLADFCTSFDPLCDDTLYWLKFADALEAAAEEIFRLPDEAGADDR
jgi:hypothetical protein